MSPLRVSLQTATDWIDSFVQRLDPEGVGLSECVGRVLAEDALASADVPHYDRAAIDGLAVRAEETAGASAYNPVRLQAKLVSAGEAVPPGCDAVVPLAWLEPFAGAHDVIQEAAPGGGIERKGCQCRSGDGLLRQGHRVVPYDIGLLAAAGISRLKVVRRPEVLCVVLDPDRGPDADGPMLGALIGRDGGVMTSVKPAGRDRAGVAGALAGRADAVIIAGGTGPGDNDVSAAAVSAAGELAIHGVALTPGETAGLGRLAGGAPVCLLPGTPAACLWAYEFLAGRMIRRLGGRDPSLPYPARRMTTTRKMVSAIGMTEVLPVRCLGDDRVGDDRVEPVASFAETGLAGVMAGDGFVIAAEGSEGVAEGSTVDVHLYRAAP